MLAEYFMLLGIFADWPAFHAGSPRISGSVSCKNGRQRKKNIVRIVSKLSSANFPSQNFIANLAAAAAVNSDFEYGFALTASSFFFALFCNFLFRNLICRLFSLKIFHIHKFEKKINNLNEYIYILYKDLKMANR